MIEYWHVIAVFAGAACNVILLFMYIRWFRKIRLSKLREKAKQLSTFYKAMAVICFLPIVSPAYWISVSPLFWDIVRPFLPALYHGAGIGMWFVFLVCFSVVFCLFCVVAASWLPSGRGKKLGLFVSSLFTLSSISSLWSLYNDLIMAIGDLHYYWTPYHMRWNRSGYRNEAANRGLSDMWRTQRSTVSNMPRNRESPTFHLGLIV